MTAAATSNTIQRLAEALTGVYARPLEVIALAEGIARRTGNPVSLAHAHFAHAVALGALTRYAEAVQEFTLAVAFCRGLRMMRLRVRVLILRGLSQILLSCEEAAARDLADALDGARALGDPFLEGAVCANAGELAEGCGADDAAERFLRHALACLPPGVPHRVAPLVTLAMVLVRRGDAGDEAEALLREALATEPSLSSTQNIRTAEATLAWLRGRRGDLARARQQLEQMRQQAHGQGEANLEVFVSSLLGEVMVWQQDWEAAVRLGTRLMANLDHCGWQGARLAVPEWLRRACEGAANWSGLAASAVAQRERLHRCLQVVGGAHFAHLLTMVPDLPATPTPRGHTAFLEAGGEMVAWSAAGALPAPAREPPPPARTRSEPDRGSARVAARRIRELSPAQREVVRGVVQGLSNAQIGQQLGKSAHTVRNQLADACARLGVRTRVQLAVACAAALD